MNNIFKRLLSFCGYDLNEINRENKKAISGFDSNERRYVTSNTNAKAPNSIVAYILCFSLWGVGGPYWYLHQRSLAMGALVTGAILVWILPWLPIITWVFSLLSLKYCIQYRIQEIKRSCILYIQSYKH